MLPWVVDLLKRLTRRLHSDGSKFVFVSPEGKPMTGHLVAEARSGTTTGQRRVEGYLVEVSSRPWDPAEEVLYDATHIHCVGAFGGSQFERACLILRNICANDRVELRQVRIRKDFLGPL